MLFVIESFLFAERNNRNDRNDHLNDLNLHFDDPDDSRSPRHIPFLYGRARRRPASTAAFEQTPRHPQAANTQDRTAPAVGSYSRPPGSIRRSTSRR